MSLLLKFLFIFLPILIAVAFSTLLERKLLSLVGLRVGPNKVSFYGILQPLGDAFKLANKGFNTLSNFSSFFYYASSFLMFLVSMSLLSCLFTSTPVISIKYSVLLFFVFLGVNSLNSMISGWSTYTKYSLMGSLRTVSQLISYEAVLYICIFFFCILFSSFDFSSFFYLNFLYLFLLLLPCFYIWMPTFLAELNRTPFDFSEGESELVSGFNTEYGSLGFTLIFLSEYSNIIFFSFLTSYLFVSFNFLFFFFFFLFFIIWIRSVVPRFRFDKLMYLAWKFFIPFLTFYFLFLVLSFI